MYICMYKTIYVDIPSAYEGMNTWLPESKSGMEKVLLHLKEWVKEHNALDPQSEISITAWGPGDKWRYSMVTSITGFVGDIEHAVDVITRLRVAR